MFNGNGGYSLADIAAATGNGNGNNDGFGGNSAWWIVILFLFAFTGGWGNWGCGNGAGGGVAGTNSVYEGYVLGNDMSMLSRQIGDGFNAQERKLDFISNGLCDGFYTTAQQVNGINTNIMSVGNAIQTQLADCCCTTQTGIADVKYAISNTGAEVSRGIERGFADTNFNLSSLANTINTNIANGFCQSNFNAQRNDTNAILSKLDAMENSRKDEKIAELTAINSDLRLAASQAAQNTYLINQLGQKTPSPCYVVPNPYCNCGGC